MLLSLSNSQYNLIERTRTRRVYINDIIEIRRERDREREVERER
jgi:hypothetical protein